MPRTTNQTTKNRSRTDLRAHFGLNELPFTRELAVRDRWRSPLFEQPLDELHTTVEHRQCAALIAPAGTGKSALLRALIEQLPEARYRVHHIKVTALGRRELCREIAAAVGLAPVGTYPALVRRLQERFENSLADDGRRPVLIIDEAHEMRPDVLGMLRILTNFEMDSRLILSLILCGQTSLRRLLAREEVEALAQRLALVLTLRPLSRSEVRSYIEHRLSLVGAKSEPFDDTALEALYELTRGNLRAIDYVARKSLELAARSSVETIDASLVADARKRMLA